ncbi:MAG: AMP-binding protein [Pseudomonadota bacterium]
MRHHGPTLHHQVTVRTVLARGLELFPDAPALVTQDGEWSWRELDRLSSNYAKNLLGAGLKPGDRIASFLPNCGDLFIHYLGVFKAGLVAVPLNYRYTHYEIDHALEVSDARAIVFDGERSDDVAGSSRAASLDLRFVFGEVGALGGTPITALMAESGDQDPPAPGRESPAVIFFTSGSTGPAKGVTHTHNTLGWVLSSTAVSYQLSPDDRTLAGSSCSHIGSFMAVLASWSQGAMAIAPRVGQLEPTLALMRRWQPTVAILLPAALFKLERDAHTAPEDFASLRVVISGGDKVPEQLETEFVEKTGLPIDEVYGMTEIGISHLNPSSGLVKFGSVGRTMPGYMAELRDETGRVVPIGEEGRLYVKFLGTMAYYWGRPEATTEVYGEDGWFDTGDMMRADEQGYYYFCGRKKQIIVHDGSNIFPQEVEEALLQHDAVENAGVIGIADLVHGENVRAFVEVREGASPISEVDLIAFAAERVGYKAPETIVFLDQMPINPTGKVDRVTLKRLAGGE